MAPEVYDSNTYSRPCDVFSFGIVMCEILTEDIPYSHLRVHSFKIPSMVASSADVRPLIPETFKVHEDDMQQLGAIESSRSAYIKLMQECWRHEAVDRPGFGEIVDALEKICPPS